MMSCTTSNLLAFAGLAATLATPALANNDRAPRGTLVPTQTAGVLYVNLQTGERTLTLYDTTNPKAIEPVQTAALFEYWMSIDENPCWDNPAAQGFGFNADATNDFALGFTKPAIGFDFGDMPFDSYIAGVLLKTATLATESTDSNSDGTLDTGIDTVSVYYDALSEANATSIAPPTAAVRIESIPGNRGATPDGFDDYDIIVDFGPGNWFELGDSDGQHQGPLWLAGANPGADITGSAQFGVQNTLDGLADFQYLQYYAQHGSNDKVTADSTYILLGAPEGTVTVITITLTSVTCTISTTCVFTTYETIFTPGPAPQAQGTHEGIGFALLGDGGDTTNLDWGDYGCCYWYGGLDCTGFLDSLQENPPENNTWYNFNPYSQIGHAFFSCADCGGGFSCQSIDFNNDTYIDNGDIGTFIQLFLTQSPAVDLNGDAIIDNGDINEFLELFLTCTG